jgi:hypothetical protein
MRVPSEPNHTIILERFLMTTTLNPNTTTNGRIRKSLAEQIDRLDHILDGLADALNQSVADAVKQAVTLAVQEAIQGILAEVLANPDLLAKLRGLVSQSTATTSAPVTAAAPAVTPSRVGTLTGKVGSWLGRGWRSVRQACTSVVGNVANALSAAKRPWQTIRQFRFPLLTALGVGIAVGVLAFCGGPFIAAVTGWIAGFVTTLAAQAGLWLRRMYAALEMPTTPSATVC